MIYNYSIKRQKGYEMNTMTAITLSQETLQEVTLKMMRANKEECLKDIEKATEKYMKKALALKNKAYAYIEENKQEVLNTLEFTLNK